MAKYITATLSVTSNAITATTKPGPTSTPQAISVTDEHDVTEVQSLIVTGDGSHGILFDASTIASSLAAGTDGAWVYLKNIHATAHFYIGHGSSTALEGGTEATRIMTLLPGEFAWFPWDLTADLIQDSNGAAADGLEAVIFVRTGTA